MCEQSFAQVAIEDRRLCVLQLLHESNGYTANENVVREGLKSAFGHSISHDRMRTDLAWLHEQGVITIGTKGSPWVARLTDYGADGVAGATWIPGIKRPSPLKP